MQRRRGRVFLQEGGISLNVPPDPSFQRVFAREIKYAKWKDHCWHVNAFEADHALDLAREHYDLTEIDLTGLTVVQARVKWAEYMGDADV